MSIKVMNSYTGIHGGYVYVNHGIIRNFTKFYCLAIAVNFNIEVFNKA